MKSGKVLLLQARYPEDPAKEHERECFVRTAAVEHEHLECRNLLDGPPTLEEVGKYDALFIGGSGDFYVSKRDLPFHDEVLALLRGVAEASHPMFGSCFGYQLLVEAMGGEVAHDPANTEVGTYELSLTAESRQDPLFGELPATFCAQMGHKDRATRHPTGIPNLASSPQSPLQALRVPGKPIWATQFHPELDRTSNLSRFERYLESYAAHLTESERVETKMRFGESPEASELLRRFLKLVAG